MVLVKNRKAQTSLEYMLLLGAVIVIVTGIFILVRGNLFPTAINDANESIRDLRTGLGSLTLPGGGPSGGGSSGGSSSFTDDFNTLDSSRWTSYIPLIGPIETISSGAMRFVVPSTRSYDHWTFADDAPQLQTAAPSGDFTLETKLTFQSSSPDTHYHTGLMVYFAPRQVLYWGFYRDQSWATGIVAEFPGSSSINYVPHPIVGKTIYLRIIKTGNVYSFSYSDDGITWRSPANSFTKAQAPQKVGLIAKTWAPVSIVADFEYFKIS